MPNLTEVFRAEAIVEPTFITIVSENDPASFGWVRHIGFDRHGLKAWERPDGSICGIFDERGDDAGEEA